MLRLFEALNEPDTAMTVNVDFPAAVGVPEITPELLSVKPAGSVPDETDHAAPDGFD